jgi:hypothetical protein
LPAEKTLTLRPLAELPQQILLNIADNIELFQ